MVRAFPACWLRTDGRRLTSAGPVDDATRCQRFSARRHRRRAGRGARHGRWPRWWDCDGRRRERRWSHRPWAHEHGRWLVRRRCRWRVGAELELCRTHRLARQDALPHAPRPLAFVPGSPPQRLGWADPAPRRTQLPRPKLDAVAADSPVWDELALGPRRLHRRAPAGHRQHLERGRLLWRPGPSTTSASRSRCSTP